MVSGWERYGRLLVERAALAGPASTSGVLTPDDVAALGGRPRRTTPGDDVAAAFEPHLTEARKAFLDELDGDGAFARIARHADLGELDATVLAICAAGEVDEGTARLMGAVRGVDGAQAPTVGLLRALLSDEAAAAVADDAPLRRAALVAVRSSGTPLGATPVQVARRVAWALLGDLSFDPDLAGDLEVLTAPVASAAGEFRVLAAGPDRVRRLEAAATAADGVAFLVSPPPADERGWEVLVAQATVAGVGVLLDVPDQDAEGRPVTLRPVDRRWLDRATHLPVAVCTADPVPVETLSRQRWAEVPVAAASVSAAEWSGSFGDAPLPPRRPTASQLRALAVISDDLPDPARALRRLASGSLLRHARRVEARATWDDLVLPPAQERRLRALVDRYRNRDLVHSGWGLPLYPSPGIVALFSGSSGTGKTTSAEVIAHELGVDLFRVDLSALVSKYIGETEKNLEEIFSAAHSGDYLLLFDEADSLFGSRSEVSDSRDRYANMEVSYLLQRLETYDGFVVLTSNFQGNIDDAFLRRIHATISFPMPGPEDRARIWTRSLAGAPIGDLDLDHVANGFELSGGSIRNAALTAAHLAAARGGSIGMVEVLAAVSEELAKLRQRLSPQLLGRWVDEVAELG